MGGGPGGGRTSQIAFVGPAGMEVAWDVSSVGAFDSETLVCPGRYNFGQGGLYRLRLTNIPGREGEELYPTLEVAPAVSRSGAFLAHNAIPVQFTEEDFGQVISGNMVTKVIYLPDPEFQDLALPGVETLVSTRLDPGVDPIEEAERRGAILGIVRMGNKDLTVAGASDADASQTGFMHGDGSGCDDGGCSDGSCGSGDCASAGGGGSGLPLGPVAGVNAPEYGMPSSGTPIGLPGPPHIPFGGQAGLQKHSIRNWTFMWIPRPVTHQAMHVRQIPGQVYPRPPRNAIVVERTRRSSLAGAAQPVTRIGAAKQAYHQ